MGKASKKRAASRAGPPKEEIRAAKAEEKQERAQAEALRQEIAVGRAYMRREEEARQWKERERARWRAQRTYIYQDPCTTLWIDPLDNRTKGQLREAAQAAYPGGHSQDRKQPGKYSTEFAKMAKILGVGGPNPNEQKLMLAMEKTYDRDIQENPVMKALKKAAEAAITRGRDEDKDFGDTCKEIIAGALKTLRNNRMAIKYRKKQKTLKQGAPCTMVN